MAVKVTLVPAQMVVAVAAIETLTGKFGFTVIVIPEDVAGFPVAHVALEVSTHAIIFPFANDELVYVVELVPMFVPFNFH